MEGSTNDSLKWGTSSARSTTTSKKVSPVAANYPRSPLPSSSRFSASSPTPSEYNSLPPPVTAKSCMSAAAKRWRYLRRLVFFRQMDFEFAFWQMFYLLVSPQEVYRNFTYRKKTKLQFARDDPAFLVLLAAWLVISSIGFSIVMGIGFVAFIQFLLYVIFVDCIGVGILVATFFWHITNKFMLKPACRDQDVEWGYCFDVHLNAFFPLLMILHFVQLFFYSFLISQNWFIATLFGNTLWLIALAYYVYINFLGYSSLSILERTKVFLYPLAPLCIFYIVSLAIDWNLTKSLVDFYHYRVL